MQRLSWAETRFEKRAKEDEISLSLLPFLREEKMGKTFHRAEAAFHFLFCQYLMYLILLIDRQNRFNIVFWFAQIFAERAYKRKTLSNAWKFIESLHIIHVYTQNRNEWNDKARVKMKSVFCFTALSSLSLPPPRWIVSSVEYFMRDRVLENFT